MKDRSSYLRGRSYSGFSMITKASLLCILLLSAALTSYAEIKIPRPTKPYDIQNGDIVFQGGNGPQAKAVQAATNSPWSHVGLVFFNQGKPWVIEAVQPVKTTLLANFIARNPRAFYAMRLKEAHKHINATTTLKAQQYSTQLIGKDYDPYFQWSDDRVYCSELVWKVYKHATGIELCKPRLLSSYNLHHPTVLKLINKRYGSMSKLPMNELTVAPSDIAQSNLLIEVPRKTSSIGKER